MCGIVAIFGLKPGTELEPLRRQAVQAAARIRHRGPDWSGVYADAGAVLAHERLSIVDIHGGAQPLRSTDGALALAVNGEIYNHRELEAGLSVPYTLTTQSDCEVINALWREQGPGFVDSLNGIFAVGSCSRESGTGPDPLPRIMRWRAWRGRGPSMACLRGCFFTAPQRAAVLHHAARRCSPSATLTRGA
jgi:asparagine synthase (glutamine-hydrolysing)